MSDIDPVDEALALLRVKRQSLMEDLGRVDEGIAALEKLSTRTGVPGATAPDPSRPSVRSMAVQLMEEGDKDWSAGEIISEYRRRGTPVHGKDPSNALRAALADAKKKGLIVSTAPGRYKATRWLEQTSDDALRLAEPAIRLLGEATTTP